MSPDTRLAVPEVPGALFVLPAPPEPPRDGTERDVARFVIEQEAARRQCYGNLAAVKDILDQWQQDVAP